MKKRHRKNNFQGTYNRMQYLKKMPFQHSGSLVLLGISLWFFWAVFQPSPVSAALYRWLDAQGQVHYSTTPPTVAVENLEIKQGTTWHAYRPREDALTPRERNVQTPEYQSQPTHSEIPYRKQQNVILVQATLNSMHTANFIIDTGATYTIISTEVAEHLGLRPDPEASLITLQAASGEIKAPLVNIATIRLGDLTIPNVMAAIHTIESSSGFSGVIGLNLLNRFTMTVDASRHILQFEVGQSASRYENRDCAQARILLDKGQRPNVQPEQEISYYDRAISLCHDLLEAYIYLAETYYLEERYQEAIDQYLALLRFIPEEPHVHYQLGFLYAISGQNFQARQEFQKTLELDPNHQEARDALEKVTP